MSNTLLIFEVSLKQILMWNIFKSHFNIKPSVGDKVVTYVGFGSRVEGVVSKVVKNGDDIYCWITKKDGSECTASYSYCWFEYI
jgi:hypothetical protein